MFLSRGVPALEVYYQFFPGKELIYYLHSRNHVPAGITTQVNDEVFHFLQLQMRHSTVKLNGCLFRKTTQFNIPDVTGYHICSVKTVNRYLVTHNFKLKKLLYTLAENFYDHCCSLGSNQPLPHPCSIYADSCNRFTGYCNDPVTCQDSHLLRRPARGGRNNNNRVIQQV